MKYSCLLDKYWPNMNQILARQQAMGLVHDDVKIWCVGEHQ
jgi:hypothetical protein